MKIILSGDSIITRNIFENDESIKLKELISNCDFSFTNLEVLPIDFEGNHSAQSDGAHFASKSSVIDDLKWLGFNLYSCANNHMLDYGEFGLSLLIKNLKEKNVSYSGIGKTLGEARKPVYLEKNNKVASLISTTSTFFPEDRAGKRNDFTEGRYGVNPLGYDVTYHLNSKNYNNILKIYEDLGLEKQLKETQDLGFLPRGEQLEDELSINDFNHRTSKNIEANFKKASKNYIETSLDEQDNEEVIQWIKEAKNRSDVSIVSIHAHESSKDRFQPAKHIRDFAKNAIDNGADIIVGHGPHLLRGIELYKGKPIFYSLGNFIGQNDQVEVLPDGTYRRFKYDSNKLPSDLFNFRSEFGTKGFPGTIDYWISILPICNFENDKLKEIELYPITLTQGDKAHLRGKPRLANEENSTMILKNIQKLSKEFNTIINIEDNIGIIKI